MPFGDDAIPVVGNGLSLGLTNGINNVAIFGRGNTTGNDQLFTAAAYGAPVGTGGSITYTYNSVGVTTDPDNAGSIVYRAENAIEALIK